MANGYNVSGLTAYVAENKDVLIKDIVLGGEGGEVIPMIAKQLGVKTSERLHPMTVSASLQEATGCGFSADGATVISERVISTAQIKANDEWCPEDLLGKFAEYQIRVSANPNEALPFESEIMSEYVKSINKQVEKLAMVGDTNDGDLFNGFVTLAEGADSASTITGSTASGASAYAAIKQTLALIPEEIQDEAVIFVSPATFREYLQDLVAANLYHYNPADGAMEEFFVPGSNVKVKKAYGLKGSSKIYANSPKNMVYGCDLLDAKEELKVWFSDDNDTYRAKVRFNAGVQTLFPDVVVVVTRN